MVIGGKKWEDFSTFEAFRPKTKMLNLLGEYDCKLDAKGRMMLPKGLKKQLEDSLHEGFVINRDLSTKSLVVYPMAVWQQEARLVNRLNKYKAKNREFIRRFNNGATELKLDAQGRLLIPSALLSSAEVDKEVKLLALNDRVELWSKKNYEQMLKEDVDMGALAEDVMGDIEPDFD
jgi:MraZ protein